MYGKVLIAKSFKGLISYLFEGHIGEQIDKKAELLFVEGIRESNYKSISIDFKRQADINSAKADKVIHIALSFHEKDTEKLSNDLLKEIAFEYLQEMKMTDTQFAIVRHNDTAHPHIHIVLNKVNYKGKMINDYKSQLRSKEISQKLAKKYGLTSTEQGKRKAGDINKDNLYGKDLLKQDLLELLRSVLPSIKSIEELMTYLSTKGINTTIKKDSNNDLVGISFERDKIAIKGSEVDKMYSAKKLLGIINKGKLDAKKKIFLDKMQQKSKSEKHSTVSSKDVLIYYLQNHQLDNFVKQILECKSDINSDFVVDFFKQLQKEGIFLSSLDKENILQEFKKDNPNLLDVHFNIASDRSKDSPKINFRFNTSSKTGTNEEDTDGNFIKKSKGFN